MNNLSLKKSQELTAFAVEKSPQMIFVVRSNGTFAFFSSGVLAELGYSELEMKGLHVTDILVGYEENDRLRLCKKITNRKKHLVRANLKKKDGTILQVESQNNSIEIDGELFNVGYCRPLNSEKRLVERQDKKEKKTQRKAQLLYQVTDKLGIVGSSRPLIETLEKALSYASNNRPVLIEGETGVGKENLAHLIHKLSHLHAAPYEIINCGTLSNELAISSLFGHVKGAFTGAIKDHDGLFSRASGGTIFFDEVGELSLAVQAMLLRVLETGHYKRLGGSKVHKANVRIIAATNRNLRKRIKKKEFREDLYYRISRLKIHLPPLRDRLGDLPVLVKHRIDQLNLHEGLGRDMPNDLDMLALKKYRFPGNIRELFGIIERAYFDGESGKLDITEDMIELAEGWSSRAAPLLTYDEVRRRHILRVLMHCKGKIYGKDGAARLLNMKRGTLYNVMNKLGIQPKPGE